MKYTHPKLFFLSGNLLLLALSLIIGLILKTTPFVIKIDSQLYVLINGLPHIYILDRISFILGVWFFPWKAFFMPAFFYFLIIPFVIFMFIKRRQKFIKSMLTIIVAYFIALVIMLIDTRFVYRERPFLHLPAQNISTSAKYILTKVTSYPSGHARDTVILVLIISYFIPSLRIPLICFAIILGFGRIYSGEHYPFDVIAGMFFGFVIAKLSIFIINEKKQKRI
jgi:membrane-associated phospholipid phosphatase